MAAYARCWPGEVTVLAQPSDHLDGNLDHIAVDPGDLPFRLHLTYFDDENSVSGYLSRPSIILATLDGCQVGLWPLMQSLGLPVVYVAEYSLATRKQMIRAETRNPLRRLRRSVRTSFLERRYRAAVLASRGVQCNGTPTFEAYRSATPRPLLYFDTRVTAEMVASDETLRSRTARLTSGGPLRLAFSGRLTAIKGVNHLPRVAVELRKMGVNFTFDVFGGGDLEPDLRHQIARRDLGSLVRLHGVVDFRTQLVPKVTEDVDLFVCCHRQGDPSCTYLETMSCGVPIVGYDNEAFAGLVRHSGTGWMAAMDQPETLARVIFELDRARSKLVEAAFSARDFAAQNTFEKTMQNRVDHLMACAELSSKLAVSH